MIVERARVGAEMGVVAARVARGALLVLLVSVLGCAGVEEVVHGLEEFEANEILVVLEAKSIAGVKVKEEGRVVTWAVAVPMEDSREARRLLVANKLPRPRSQGLAQVYPAGGGGLIPTKSEEKARFLMAIQGEIERKLKALPGVVQAHVSIVDPEKDVVRNLETSPPAATASVAIVFNPTDDRGGSLVSSDEIKTLVAASVENLKAENVQVVMKKNTPTTLVDVAVKGVSVDEAAPAMSESVFGIKVTDKKSGMRAKVLLALFLGVAVVGLALGIGGMWRAILLQQRLGRSEAELSSFRRGRRVDGVAG